MNNREIKFRVWDTKNKQFIPQSYFAILGNGKLIITESSYYNHFTNTNADDYIIQQFTGAVDKNGKEIYEGDIFKGGEKKWDAVEFMDGKFIVNLQGSRVFDLDELCDISSRNYLEVVGNICENPELI